jgi:hypothetical protein
VLLGSKQKTGFETSIHTDGYSSLVYAEALDADGRVLGRTPKYRVEPPADWKLFTSVLAEGRPEETVASSTVSDIEQSGYADSDSMDIGACSVYDKGCKPVVKPQNVGVAPVEKTEL